MIDANSIMLRILLGYDPEEEIALSQTEDAQSLANIIQNQPAPAAPTQPGQPPMQPGQQPAQPEQNGGSQQ